MAFPVPLILSPALPSELLSYILQHEAYPTTLIICYPRADFLSSLVSEIQGPSSPRLDESDDHHHPQQDAAPAAAPLPNHSPSASSLLSTRLYQVAIARHIRIAFVPTVSHLRAYLAAFQPSDDSKVPPPPLPPPAAAGAAHGRGQKQQQQQQGHSHQPPPPPLLLVYGFLALHRDTSEWSAQGLSGTAAALVEASRTSGLRAVLVEPPRVVSSSSSSSSGAGLPEQEKEEDKALDEAQGGMSAPTTAAAAAAVGGDDDELHLMLAEQMPVLSASVVRAGGGDFDEGAWMGRKVTVGRVLGRWFRYRERQWSK